jgi:hypothetical protein
VLIDEEADEAPLCMLEETLAATPEAEDFTETVPLAGWNIDVWTVELWLTEADVMAAEALMAMAEEADECTEAAEDEALAMTDEAEDAAEETASEADAAAAETGDLMFTLTVVVADAVDAPVLASSSL